MRFRLRAVALHFLGSLVVVALAALMVFGIWFPVPYTTIAGGAALFGLLVCIDVVIGPALTGLVANSAKPRRELRRDIGVIVALQTAALLYGMFSIANARPAYVVFEVDRFRVVSVADLRGIDLDEAPAGLGRTPWTGPVPIGTRKPVEADDFLQSLGRSLDGIDLALQPKYWVPFEVARPSVLEKARSVDVLLRRYPQLAADASSLSARYGVQPDRLKFLPITSRSGEGIALITAPTAQVVDVLDGDAFF